MNGEFYASLKRQYSRARDKLQAQTKAVDKRKKAYHKAMFNVEKKAIKAELAMTPEVAAITKKELGDLTKKVVMLKDKYRSQIIEWRSKFAVLLELTSEMAQIRAKEESICLNYCLSSMHQKVPPTSDSPRDAKADEKEKVPIIDKVQVLKDKIFSPAFEEYIPAGKRNEMFRAALAAMTGKPEGNDSDRSEKKSENDDRIVTKDAEAILKDVAKEPKLPPTWKAHINAVIKDYKKRNFDELSLHAGDQVIQVLPSDNSGMAFGVKKCGLLRKKKGFFPVSHVQESGVIVERNEHEVKKRNSSNPVLRLLEAITEPKTKVSLLQEVASDDGAKAFDDKKKSKKLLCKRNWLKTIYGIEISDDEIYLPTKNADEYMYQTPVATNMSPERCTFSKMAEPIKIAFITNPSAQKDLVLEDIESTEGQQDDSSRGVGGPNDVSIYY